MDTKQLSYILPSIIISKQHNQYLSNNKPYEIYHYNNLMQTHQTPITFEDIFLKNSMNDELTIKINALEKTIKSQDLVEDIERPKLPSSLAYLWDLCGDDERISLGEFSDNWITDTIDLYEKFEFDFSESSEVATSQTLPIKEVNAFSELEHMTELTKKRKHSEAFDSDNTNVASNKGYCNCQKSKCLKLYCECFALQQCCVNCNCVDCHNLPKYNEETKAATAKVKAKNPLGFSRRSTASQKPLVGCNCNKSKCQRNYCSCHKAGLKCTEACKCNQCKNCESPLKKRKGVESYIH